MVLFSFVVDAKGRIMQVTRRSEYAILSVLYLAENRRLCDIGEIAESQKLPVSFVAKTLQGLARAGLLFSRRGQGGGFSLARPAHDINLLEIIQAVEGEIAISKCLDGETGCENNECRLEPVWRHVQDQIKNELRSITLRDIINGGNGGNGSLKGLQPVILCDFDGTISKQDVSDTIFTVWLGEKWAEIDKEWHDEKISMVELYEKCWSLIGAEAGEAELYEFIDRVEIDPYFDGFVHECRGSEVPVYLVSDGFDLYIERIMGRHGLSGLTHYSNHLFFDKGRPVPEFNNSHPDCIQCANCKKFVIDKKRGDSDYVIYIGNGLSDRCAAEHADLVFAKDSLLKHCKEKGIPCVPYRDFSEITDYLKERKIFGESSAIG